MNDNIRIMKNICREAVLEERQRMIEFIFSGNQDISKYDTPEEFIDAYNKYLDEKSEFKTQYTDDDTIWNYIMGPICNKCKDNYAFHHIYSKKTNKVYVACNSCGTIVKEFKDEYTQKELDKGIWK